MQDGEEQSLQLHSCRFSLFLTSRIRIHEFSKIRIRVVIRMFIVYDEVNHQLLPVPYHPMVQSST
jgi:hypothetical protein